MTRFVPAAIIALSFIALALVGRAVDDHLAERESNKMTSELDHLPPSEIRERIEAVEELRKDHPGRVPLGPTDQSEFARQVALLVLGHGGQPRPSRSGGRPSTG